MATSCGSTKKENPVSILLQFSRPRQGGGNKTDQNKIKRNSQKSNSPRNPTSLYTLFFIAWDFSINRGSVVLSLFSCSHAHIRRCLRRSMLCERDRTCSTQQVVTNGATYGTDNHNKTRTRWFWAPSIIFFRKYFQIY